MSASEKRLLTLFAIAAFAVVNLLGFSLYKKKSAALAGAQQTAERKLRDMDLLEASREQRLDQMVWLQEQMPKPAEYENVQTKLQKYCQAEAEKVGLTVKNWTPLKRDELKGNHFDRVAIKYRIEGMEKDLYGWLDRVNMPTDLRRATRLELSPNEQDKTRINCDAIVEQWFVPAGPSI